MLLRLVGKIRKNGEQNNNHSMKDEHGGEGRWHSNVKTKGRKEGETRFDLWEGREGIHGQWPQSSEKI